MSLPTLYFIKDHADKELGCLYGSIWSMFPLSRTRDQKRFDADLGHSLIDDLIPYVSGQQDNAPQPKFALHDVNYIQSGETIVSYTEFPDCVQSYIDQMDEIYKPVETKNKQIMRDIKNARHVKKLFEDNIVSASEQNKKINPPKL